MPEHRRSIRSRPRAGPFRISPSWRGGWPTRPTHRSWSFADPMSASLRGEIVAAAGHPRRGQPGRSAAGYRAHQGLRAPGGALDHDRFGPSPFRGGLSDTRSSRCSARLTSPGLARTILKRGIYFIGYRADRASGRFARKDIIGVCATCRRRAVFRAAMRALEATEQNVSEQQVIGGVRHGGLAGDGCDGICGAARSRCAQAAAARACRRLITG